MYTVRPSIQDISCSADGTVHELFHEGELQLAEFTPQLNLTCEAYGSPQPEIDWLKDGIVLQNLTDRRIITVEDGGSFGNLTRATLILSVVQVSDAGEYTCRATSGGVSPILGLTAWSFVFKVTGELSSE